MNRASSSQPSQPDPANRVLTAKTSAKTSAKHCQPSSNLSRPVSRPRLQRTAKTVSPLQHDSDNREAESLSLIVNTQPDSIPNLFVQISQHSNLDRDQYPQYLSSLSTQSYLSSAPPHEDSGLGESSSDIEDLRLSKSDHELIVPDSQSLPGSSSYQPTVSAIENLSSHRERRVHQYHSCCSPHPSVYSSDPSNSFEARHSEPTEDSSGVYVAESPENSIYSQSSASVPDLRLVQSSGSSAEGGSPFVRFAGFGNRNLSSSRSETVRPSFSLKSQEEISQSQIPVSTISGSQVRTFLKRYHFPVPVCEPCKPAPSTSET